MPAALLGEIYSQVAIFPIGIKPRRLRCQIELRLTVSANSIIIYIGRQ